MDLSEAFKLIAEGSDIFVKGLLEHPIQNIAWALAAILTGMKAYTFGRDKVLKKVRHFIIAESGFWLKKPARSIANHIARLNKSIPVLTVVNFKGGVGKSTMAANLAAYFDSSNVRTLLIDFDYQGSLSDCVISKDGNVKFGAVHLINDDKSTEQILQELEDPRPAFKRTNILAAAYSLNHAENKATFRWLVGDTKTDLRYSLARFLASPSIQNRYDIVIIDAAPRLTLTTVNALCASTHVVVPTILDGTSSNAAIQSVDAIEQLKSKLSPTLKILGVVPTFIDIQNRYGPRELENLAYLRQQLSERVEGTSNQRIHIFENERILRKSAIANVAGNNVAYFTDATTKQMYSALAREISLKFGKNFVSKVQDEGLGSETWAGNAQPVASTLGS